MSLLQPQLAVGAVVVHEGALLLVRRGHPPDAGLWAIPGGRLRLGETLAAGAEREILEETGVRIRAGEVVYTVDFIDRDGQGRVRYHYVIVDLAGEYLDGEPRAGDDAVEARWIRFIDLPGLGLNSSSATALRRLYPQHFTQEGG